MMYGGNCRAKGLLKVFRNELNAGARLEEFYGAVRVEINGGVEHAAAVLIAIGRDICAAAGKSKSQRCF